MHNYGMKILMSMWGSVTVSFRNLIPLYADIMLSESINKFLDPVMVM